jgi:hypothetical protein
MTAASLVPVMVTVTVWVVPSIVAAVKVRVTVAPAARAWTVALVLLSA